MIICVTQVEVLAGISNIKASVRVTRSVEGGLITIYGINTASLNSAPLSLANSEARALQKALDLLFMGDKDGTPI